MNIYIYCTEQEILFYIVLQRRVGMSAGIRDFGIGESSSVLSESEGWVKQG